MPETQPLLSNGQLVAWAVSLVLTLGSVVSFLFYRLYDTMAKRLEDCERGRAREVEAANREKERAWQQFAELQRTIAAEAEKDRVTLREMNASWQGILEPPRRGR